MATVRTDRAVLQPARIGIHLAYLGSGGEPGVLGHVEVAIEVAHAHTHGSRINDRLDDDLRTEFSRRSIGEMPAFIASTAGD